MRRYFPGSVLTRYLVLPLVVCLAAALALFATSGRTGDPRTPEAATPVAQLSRRIAQLHGDRALRQAHAAVTVGRKNPSVSLTRLSLAYPTLSEDQKKQADVLLARPTDGAADPFLDGYDPGATVRTSCTEHFCIHYVTTGADAPPMADKDGDTIPNWVERITTKVEAVWTYEIGTLGYRAPIPDGTRGGDARFDFYLAQLGDRGVYGYCPAENPEPGQEYVYSAYCVLDDDFAEFPLPPMPSFRVTVAHEFFHAVQYAYDAAEDPWLMEATATWMEERFADGIDDNRQYLPYGQLGNPKVPLDQHPAGAAPYGNWIFFEAFTKAYGDGAVRAVWERADARAGSADEYSTQAVGRYLRSQGSNLRKFYTSFALGNLTPGVTYEEGAVGGYPAAPVDNAWTLKPEKPAVSRDVLLDHYTSYAMTYRPAATLSGAWRLRIDFDLPKKYEGPGVAVTVERLDGKLVGRPLDLDKAGVGIVGVNFDPATVSRVIVTLVNASPRFTCWQDSSFSCQGESRDDMMSTYHVGATLVSP